jgi:hypothetical protein
MACARASSDRVQRRAAATGFVSGERDLQMKIDKFEIVNTLRRQGLHARADWADRGLPDLVDTVDNAGILATLGIDPAEFDELARTQPTA